MSSPLSTETWRVRPMGQATFFEPVSFPREWGEETIVTDSTVHRGKVLWMRAGTKGGLQFHIKEESHYVLSGRMIVRWDDDGKLTEREVQAGRAWRMPAGVVHQEEALTDCVILEVSDPTSDDRVRVEAEYGLDDGGGLPSMTPDQARAKLRGLSGAFMAKAAECLMLYRDLPE